MKIPFNKPTIINNEFKYMREAVKQGHISGDGIFTQKSNELLKKITGCKKSLLTTSCTHALEMAALLLEVKPGDEVIIPSFTFVSTVNAFVLRGAKPVFIDCRPDTLNMDEKQLESLISPKTKVIIPVHYAGVSCEMDAIMGIANSHNIAVVEDNAHGLFGRYKDKELGSFGVFAAQSFHETKNMSCGEGGALLINDSAFSERAEIIREKGTNRSKFFRGEVDKYGWVDIGSSYLPSDLLAAFLYAQLKQHQVVQNKRKHIWDTYYRELQSWALQKGVRLPTVPSSCEQSYHMFYMILPNVQARDSFIQTLKTQGIHTVFHYLPLHLSKMGRQFGGKLGDCPVTEDISERLVRLPMFYALTNDELSYICEKIKNI